MRRWLLTPHRLGGLLLLAFCCVYGWLSFDIPQLAQPFAESFDARTLPQFLAVLGAVLSLALIAQPGGDPMPDLARLSWGRFAAALALMFAYAAIVRPAGFLLATTLFLAVGFRLLGARNLPLLAGIALALSIAFWALVTQVLGIYMPALPAGVLAGV